MRLADMDAYGVQYAHPLSIGGAFKLGPLKALNMYLAKCFRMQLHKLLVLNVL